jgi:hypothetical protein
MNKEIINLPHSRGWPIETRGRFLSPGKSIHSRRALIFLVLVATALLLVGCTDHLDVTGLPTTCGKDKNGKDIHARVEVKISQAVAGDLQRDTKIVNSKGVAEFMIGADTSKRLLKPGHRTPNAPKDFIYTGDPVSIELKFKDPCKVDTKTKTVTLDALPQKKHNGRVTYELAYTDF